jgi:hypothetical protein
MEAQTRLKWKCEHSSIGDNGSRFVEQAKENREKADGIRAQGV